MPGLPSASNIPLIGAWFQAMDMRSTQSNNEKMRKQVEEFVNYLDVYICEYEKEADKIQKDMDEELKKATLFYKNPKKKLQALRHMKNYKMYAARQKKYTDQQDTLEQYKQNAMTTYHIKSSTAAIGKFSKHLKKSMAGEGDSNLIDSLEVTMEDIDDFTQQTQDIQARINQTFDNSSPVYDEEELLKELHSYVYDDKGGNDGEDDNPNPTLRVDMQEKNKINLVPMVPTKDLLGLDEITLAEELPKEKAKKKKKNKVADVFLAS